MSSSGNALNTSGALAAVAGCKYDLLSSAKEVTPSRPRVRITSSSSSSSMRSTPALQAADADDICAERDRLHHIRAAAKAAIDHDLRAALHRVHDLGQHMHGAAAVIELSPAMVGDID